MGSQADYESKRTSLQKDILHAQQARLAARSSHKAELEALHEQLRNAGCELSPEDFPQFVPKLDSDLNVFPPIGRAASTPRRRKSVAVGKSKTSQRPSTSPQKSSRAPPVGAVRASYVSECRKQTFKQPSDSFPVSNSFMPKQVLHPMADCVSTAGSAKNIVMPNK